MIELQCMLLQRVILLGSLLNQTTTSDHNPFRSINHHQQHQGHDRTSVTVLLETLPFDRNELILINNVSHIHLKGYLLFNQQQLTDNYN